MAELAASSPTLPDDIVEKTVTLEPIASSNSQTAVPTHALTPQLTNQSSTNTPHSLETVNPENPTATKELPCYRATFIEDVTFSDGTSVPPGEIFIKIWRFRNDGSCEWTYEFYLDFVGGQRLSGPDDIPVKFYEPGTDLALDLGDSDWTDRLVYRVPPGEVVDIAIVLRAPLEEGRHRGFWRVLSAKEGKAVIQFYVDIDVPYTVEEQRGVWSGEWEHYTNWSDTTGNPLVLHQQDRQVTGYYYNSDGECNLIEASLSADEIWMEGVFGQQRQAGFPFILELFPNENAFHGLYNDSSFTGGAWCGNRSGYAVPTGECQLER